MPSLAILPLPKPSPQSLSSFKTPIRMGGGPRTFPGGVSKWQWKRMQANKSKQILKARLCRERQIYEMRKRAELKSAISQLEKPWEEVAQRAAVIFSVDEQIKALADRFQRPSGFDMWSERDGPRIFAGNLARGSDSDLAVCGLKMNGDDVKSFYGSESEMKKEEKEGGISNRSVYRNASAGGFDRNQGSYRSDSDLAVYGSKMNGDDMQSSYGSDSEMKKEEKGGEIRFEKNGKEGRNQESYCSDSEIVVYGAKIDGQFDRRSDNRGLKMRRDDVKSFYGSESEMKKEEKEGGISNRSVYRNASAGGFDRNQGSYRSDSHLAVYVSKMNGDDMQSSYGSVSEMKKEDKEGEFRFEKNGKEWRNQESYCSDSEIVVSDSKIDGQFDRHGDDRGSLRRDSDLEVYGSKMSRDDMARHWGLDLRFERNSDSYGSQSDFGSLGNQGSAESKSRMQRREMSGGFERRRGRGGSGEIGNWSAGGFDRRGGRGGLGEIGNVSVGGFDRRGGRGGNQGSYRSDSELPLSGYRNGTGGFDRRGGRGGNQGSYRSDSELARSGYQNASASGFDRRGGRGGNQGSYRSNFELARSGYRNASAIGFDRRGGRGANQGSYRSDSELPLSGYRNGTGGFDGRGGRGGNQGSYLSDSELARSGYRNASAGGFDRRSGRGGNRGSYRSDSELAHSGYRNASAGGFDRRGDRGGNGNSYGLELEIENGGFRKGRVQNTGGRERDYRDEGRVSLRPTTELRVEEGDARRVRKWNEGRNKGFRSSRGTRLKD